MIQVQVVPHSIALAAIDTIIASLSLKLELRFHKRKSRIKSMITRPQHSKQPYDVPRSCSDCAEKDAVFPMLTEHATRTAFRTRNTIRSWGLHIAFTYLRQAATEADAAAEGGFWTLLGRTVQPQPIQHVWSHQYCSRVANGAQRNVREGYLSCSISGKGNGVSAYNAARSILFRFHGRGFRETPFSTLVL